MSIIFGLCHGLVWVDIYYFVVCTGEIWLFVLIIFYVAYRLMLCKVLMWCISTVVSSKNEQFFDCMYITVEHRDLVMSCMSSFRV